MWIDVDRFLLFRHAPSGLSRPSEFRVWELRFGVYRLTDLKAMA